MSADNGLVLRTDEKGLYVLQEYIYSIGYPDIKGPAIGRFELLGNALDAATDAQNTLLTEYGLSIHTKKYCSLCGPGYQPGDEGCRHTNNSEKDSTPMAVLETKTYARKPFTVDGVRLTADNINEVAAWCGGEVKTEPQTGKLFVKVKVNRPINARQTEAYVGDWVLKAGTGFKVYTPKAFRDNFDEISVETTMQPVPDPEPQTGLVEIIAVR